jgi:hypothetical protein
MKQFVLALAALLITTHVAAHGPSKGAHGGRQVDAGDYHLEMVAKDALLAVYLSDQDDNPVDIKGYRAVGIFVVGGKPQRIELKPESANKLTGTSTMPLPATLKGAVQITLPSGKTVQAKFE